jgi:signal transduction histidine kinase
VSRRVAKGVVPALAAAAIALAVVGAFLLARLHDLGGAPQNAGIGDVLGSLGFVAAGSFLARRRPGHPIGWLLLGIGLTEEMSNVTESYGTLGHRIAGGLPLTNWVLELGAWLWLPGFAALLTLLLQIYPDGRLPTVGARRLLRLSVLAIVGAAVAVAIAPGSVRDADTPTAVNPVGWSAGSKVLGLVSGPLLLVCVLLSLLGILRRLWRASTPLRQQIAWLLTAAVVTGLAKGLVPITWVSSGSLALIPVAVAIGVVRYRLLGIETVVRRTLLYAPLTALVALAFTAITAGLTVVLPDGPLPNLLAAGVVVVGLAPVRDLLQHGVDRLVRGPRIDPLHAVAGVGAAVLSGEDAGLVDRVVESVATALRSPYVAVVTPSGELLAGCGQPLGETYRIPLRHAGQEIAELRVAGDTDVDLLAALAPQVAVVVRAAGLNADLAAARQQAVGAALVERGRLRRDLHDGLGPSLSGVALGLEAAVATVDADPETARSLLDRVGAEVTAAVAEVHRLLDGLRPPELGTYGLAAALRERLAVPGAGPQVVVDAPVALPPLHSDVELAAYRIVCEAVTNVRKHANASRCEVRVVVRSGELILAVVDDGLGIRTDAPGGVGLVSMRHRAEEVGGTLSIGPSPAGGTLVQATLPTGQL